MASVRSNRKRRRSRGRFGPLFKLLCALAVVVALTMGATVFFQVETVVISGNSRYTQEDVVGASGIQIGDNLFRLNKYQIAADIRQKLPYVEKVNIVRHLPSTIVITISEWDAVARIQAPSPGTVVSEEDAAAVEDAAGDSSGSDKGSIVAQEDWLISVGGKLLESAPADSTAILVSGITPLVPRAGTMLVLPQAEQAKLNALLGLLSELEEQEMMAQVSSIELGSTQILMRYLDRFTVKMPLNADFNYKLRVLAASVEEIERELGDRTSGTFDLTQEGKAAIYSPE